MTGLATPRAVFDPLNYAFDFTGDACSTSDDGSTPSWDELGPRVWCNPPESRQIGRWYDQVDGMVASQKVKLAMMLSPANTETKYWRDHVANSVHCHAVVFLRPRMKAGRSHDARKGSALILFHHLPRLGRWPVHSYADFMRPNWIQDSGLHAYSKFALKRGQV